MKRIRRETFSNKTRLWWLLGGHHALHFFSLIIVERLILCHVLKKLRINASPERCVYEQTITRLAAASMEYRSKQQPSEEMLGEAIGWKVV
jgi:hypothetical protein